MQFWIISLEEKVENKSEGLKRLDFKEMSKQSFMDLENEKLNKLY